TPSLPVLTCPADSSAGKEGTQLTNRKSALLGIVAKRDGFLGSILHHAQADGVIQLVHVGEILVWLTRPAPFQDNNVQAGARTEFFGHEQACPAASDNDNVHARESSHCSSSLGWNFVSLPKMSCKLAGLGRKASPKCLSTSF